MFDFGYFKVSTVLFEKIKFCTFVIIIRHNPEYLQMKIVVLGFSIEFAIFAENFEIKWAFRAYFVDFCAMIRCLSEKTVSLLKIVCVLF